jgi:hypothetical protein
MMSPCIQGSFERCPTCFPLPAFAGDLESNGPAAHRSDQSIDGLRPVKQVFLCRFVFDEIDEPLHLRIQRFKRRDHLLEHVLDVTLQFDHVHELGDRIRDGLTVNCRLNA